MSELDPIRAQRIEALKAKLKAREGKPGFKANVEMIREQLVALEAADGFRDKESGEFVSLEHAFLNPESVERAGLTDGH